MMRGRFRYRRDLSAAGTFILNCLIGPSSGNGIVGPLAEDTDPANVGGEFNYARCDGLTPDGSNNRSFSMGNGDAPVQFNLGTVKDATFLRAETAP